MRRSKSFVARRRESIVALLEEQDGARVADLADYFEVSALTIRRDLDALEQKKLVMRHYGRVFLVNTLGRPAGSRHVMAKIAIAKEAARHVCDGDAIFLNASSTALEMIEYIDAQDVSIITNNSKVMLLHRPLQHSVILTGGDARPPRASLTGQLALDTIRRYKTSKCFLGCSGISATAGLTSNTINEPAVDALMLEHSLERYVLLDSSKIGAELTYPIAPAKMADVVITDDGATQHDVDQLIAAGVKDVIRVSAHPMDTP